jgi:hypothetical protein
MNEYNIQVNYKKDFWPIVIALLIIFSSITGFFSLNQYFYIGAIALCGVIAFNKGKLEMGNKYIPALIIVCILSILFNDVPSYFRAWQRLGIYTIMLFIMSPLLISRDSYMLKTKIFIYIWYFTSILSIGSFFCYYLGINYFKIGSTLQGVNVGTFSGLMNHSMALGPMSGLSTIFLFVHALLNKKNKAYYYIAAILCLGACFVSASRAAVGATIVGCVVALSIINRNNISRTYRILLIIVAISSATFPIWGGVTDFVVEKQEINKEQGGTSFSRDVKFDARLKEFNISPLYGIGFCTIDPTLDEVNYSDGQIEPGSSWLAIASMTGVLGLLVMIPLCISSLKKARRIKDDYWRGILFGMLMFYIIHMTVEGYIYAPMSYLSLFFWMIIAVIDGELKYGK